MTSKSPQKGVKLSEVIEDFDKEIASLERGGFTLEAYTIAVSYIKYAYSLPTPKSK